jgi:hypothetical protein
MTTAINVIDTRFANALIPDATASERALQAAGQFTSEAAAIAHNGSSLLRYPLSRMFPRVIKSELEWVRNRQGGLWVGGKAILTNTDLSFMPNAVNAAVHAAPDHLSWSVPLVDVTAVLVRRGLLTSVIDVQARSGRVNLRCFRANAFAAHIEKARFSIES